MQDANDSGQDFWERQEQIYKSAYVSIGLLVINVLIFILSNTIMGWMYEKGAMITEVVLRYGEFYR